MFQKTQTQNDAIEKVVNSDASNICFYGSSRSGKSFLIMRIILIRAARVRSDHIICRETFSSVKASIWQKTLPDVLRMCFPDLQPKFNHTDYICTLPNGSTLKIAGLDDQKKIERILGTEYSSLWFNESNQIAYPAVNKLKTRLAQKNKLRKMSYFDLNPTKTTSWVYQVFEESVNPQDGEMLRDTENYLSVQMNVHGNLKNLDEQYLAILEAMPELERKRFLDGEYDSSNMGKAVYAFNKDDHVCDKTRRLNGTAFTGTDFNIEYNSDILASMNGDPHNDTGVLNIWDEIQIAGDTYKKADELIKKKMRGATVIADSTGKNRSTSGKSNFVILREAGFDVKKTHNPFVVDKIANLNRCFTLGLIKIHPRCKKLIRDLTQLEWRKDGELDQKTDESLSHLVDCLAYLCWYFFPLKEDHGDVRIRMS